MVSPSFLQDDASLMAFNGHWSCHAHPLPPPPFLRFACLTPVVIAALVACGSVPQPVLPNQVPPAWRGAPAEAGAVPAPDLQAWWRAMGDPVLDQLVQRALGQNLSLAQARSRLRQARLLAGRDAKQFLPEVGANARTVQDAAAIDSYFHASLDVTWELGLFGAREAVDSGGQARLAQATAGEQAAKVTVVAEVVRNYLQLRAAQQDIALLQRMLGLDDMALALHDVRLRTRTGSMDERDSLVRRQAQTRALLAAPRHSEAQALQALATLLAQTEADGAWAQAGSLQLPGRFVLQQVPADLLRVRPDVRSAEAKVAQAASELGQAQAELYPRVVLGLSFLYAYNLTNNRRTAGDHLPAFGPLIDIPLFDWERRRAVADARDEALHEALLAYRSTVVEAVGETETALTGLALARERLERLSEVLQLSARQSARQREQQRLGLSNALDGAELERARLQAELELGSAQLACGQALVLLYKSLGGASLAQADAEPDQRTRQDASP